MLKKLVRYGNSNALVLDRAILELLNMKEGSLVKLHTDGTSLIITPEHSTKTEQVSTSGVERIQEYLQQYKNSPQQNVTSTKNYAKLQETIKEIMAKHTDAFSGYDHQAFLSEVDTLAETKYQGDTSSPEFIAEVKTLQAKYSPALAAAQQEIAEAAKKLGY